MEGKTVLVTGGAGFIGGHLVDALRDQNTVRVLDTDPVSQDGEGTPIQAVIGDIRDEKTVERAIDGVDVVFHEAALVSVAESIARPSESHAINVEGTLNVLEAARKHDAKVVVASSAAVYGDPHTVPISERHSLDPRSPYGLEKLAADRYTSLYNDQYGLETVALRYFNVYGPGSDGGDYAGVIDVFLEQARNHEPITVHGNGSQTRDFVHVEDVVRANRLAVEAGTEAVGQAYNIGTGESVSILGLAELVRDLTNSESEIVHTPPRSGDIKESCADISRARERLGFKPTVELEDGLRALVEYRDSIEE